MKIVNYEEFLKDLVDNFDDMTISDLQGVVEARCIETKENENAILNDIYNKIRNRGE